jgi:hypothetical protein
MLTPLQIACFQAFGFLHLPGAIAADVGWIVDEYERVWADHPELNHDGSVRTTYPGLFIAQTPRLSTLLDHPVIAACADGLIGEGWTLTGGDGNRYSGDTGWHSDISPDQWAPKTACNHLKIAFYLDALTPETGSLRVIPGSHHHGDRFADLVDAMCPWMGHESVLKELPGKQVPCVALTQQPGDLLMFDHRLKHASFGGSGRRRMFTMNLQAPCRNEVEREAALTVFRHYRDRENVTYDWDQRWLASLTPGARRRMDLCLDLSAQVRAEKQGKLAAV